MRTACRRCGGVWSRVCVRARARGGVRVGPAVATGEDVLDAFVGTQLARLGGPVSCQGQAVQVLQGAVVARVVCDGGDCGVALVRGLKAKRVEGGQG